MLWRGRELGLDDNQVLAIWYHDAVYDVPGPENEVRSAALAREQLGAAGWAAADIDVVERIVLDTIEHRPSLPAAELVIDLDLASLGAEPAGFAQNTANLRVEYGHLDDDAFRAAQRAVCERFLARDRIYCTEWGRRFEAPARRNLEDCLSSLP